MGIAQPARGSRGRFAGRDRGNGSAGRCHYASADGLHCTERRSTGVLSSLPARCSGVASRPRAGDTTLLVAEGRHTARPRPEQRVAGERRPGRAYGRDRPGRVVGALSAEPYPGAVGGRGDRQHRGKCRESLRDILDLRTEYRARGLDFAVHADAAWGGYFNTMLRNEDIAEDPAAEVPDWPMSRHVNEQYPGTA